MFHEVCIKDIRQETSDCISISFDIPLDLQDIFRYKAGQYLTLKRIIEGEDVRRSYSICSSPLDNEWRIAIKKVPFGTFSNHAHDNFKKGDTIELMPPAGRFTVNIMPENAHYYVGIAVGSGITPILSIIKTVLESEPSSHFTLLFGNKKRASVMFKETIEGLKNQYMKRFSVYYILSEEFSETALLRGRIDDVKLNYFFKHLINKDQIDGFYICGPEDMTHALKTCLEVAGIDKTKIHFELFGVKKQPLMRGFAATLNDKKQSAVTIRLDGSEFTMPLGYDGNSVLDEAMMHGADLPYACKGGVCCTCKAKLVEGLVEMTVNYGLEPAEMAAGFILTCQAHPRSARVVVDFDAK